MLKLNGVVQRKLAILDDYLTKLSAHLENITLLDFKEDWASQRSTERALQVMIEVIIDISERIIALKQAGPIATSADAFDKLVSLGIIKDSTKYKKMVGFRNILVHEYCTVDPEILYKLGTEHLKDFLDFRAEVDRVVG